MLVDDVMPPSERKLKHVNMMVSCMYNEIQSFSSYKAGVILLMLYHLQVIMFVAQSFIVGANTFIATLRRWYHMRSGSA